MGASKASFVKRARMSAEAGPYLLLAGVVLAGLGIAFTPPHITLMAVMALAAPFLQIPRQRAWRAQNDALEFASLAAMPVLLGAISMFWLWPAGLLSLWTAMQGLGAFFACLGVFHILTKRTLLKSPMKSKTNNRITRVAVQQSSVNNPHSLRSRHSKAGCSDSRLTGIKDTAHYAGAPC